MEDTFTGQDILAVTNLETYERVDHHDISIHGSHYI